MTLIEALKTGRRIRRYSSEVGGFYTPNPDDLYHREAILADDWEVEPEPKKKVKKWLWAEKKTAFIEYELGFMTENTLSGIHDPSRFIKLPWSETEFEE